MVTEMDRAAEALIVERLLGARPDDGMLGEEGTDDAGTSGVRWVVDPLDGTTNYLYGLPGLRRVDRRRGRRRRPWPASWSTSSATSCSPPPCGGGATRDGRPIRRIGADRPRRTRWSPPGSPTTPTAGAGRPRCSSQVLPRVRDIRRFGAAAVDLCSVACGRVDAYYERGLAPWDLAAGGLIAAEAGAVVTDFDGGPPGPASSLAAAPGIAEPLRDARSATAGAGHA